MKTVCTGLLTMETVSTDLQVSEPWERCLQVYRSLNHGNSFYRSTGLLTTETVSTDLQVSEPWKQFLQVS